MGLLDNTTPQQYYNSDNFGNYQFISLSDIIKQFEVFYVGEDKILTKARRLDIAFHAQRAMQELSFDTFKSVKSIEVELPTTLLMTLPQDYVNYVKLTWSDAAGIEHIMYPSIKTSNPTNLFQNSDGDYFLTAVGDLVADSPNIVLDAEYKDIEVGMKVTGPYIPGGTFVKATSNTNNITTVTIYNGNDDVPIANSEVTPLIPNTSDSISNTNTTLTFSKTDGSLILEKDSIVIVENLDWLDTDYKITANAEGDITDVKIGMLVSHDNFPIGTTVTNVSGTTIVVSHLPDTAVSSNGGEVTFISPNSISDTWNNYKSEVPTENQNQYDDDTYWPLHGSRYGIDPQHAQSNGSFFIDENTGKIHFSSNISGKTVILHYISDGLGTDEETKVHKFAEEAMYKYIMHGILSTRANIPEYMVNRYKREKRAAIRNAKLRLSNIKLEEITQVLRSKSKHIKH